MLLRCIQAENMKFKHSVIYLAFIAIPIIPAIMGTFNYLQNLFLHLAAGAHAQQLEPLHEHAGLHL